MESPLNNENLWRQSASYMVYFGLHTPPFLATDLEKFFFQFPLFSQRLHMLQGLVTGEEYLTLVIGDKGSGKSTLLDKLLEVKHSTWTICRIRCYSSLDSDTLYRRIASAYGLNQAAGPITADSINQTCMLLRRKKQLPVILLDDSHELSPAVLLALCQIGATGDSRANARIVLFSEPQINNTLAKIDPDLPKQAILNKIFILPFNESQTEAYITHRLNKAGMTGQNPLTAKCIQSIHEQSGGLPDLINYAAHSLFHYNISRKNFGAFEPIPPHDMKAFDQTRQPVHTSIDHDDTDSGSYRPGWLLKQNPQHFTIQLMSARKEAIIEKTIKNNPALQKAVYYHSYYKGKDWYTMVFGIYTSKDDAEALINSLPDHFPDLSWVRPVLSVQESIKKGKRFSS